MNDCGRLMSVLAILFSSRAVLAAQGNESALAVFEWWMETGKWFGVVGALLILFVVLYFTLQGILLTRRMGEQLEHAYGSMQLAFDSVDMGMWSWDPATGNVTFDRGGAICYGFEPGEIEPSFGFWQSRLHPEEHVAILERLKAFLRGAELKFQLEYRGRCKSDEYQWMLLNGMAERDTSGRVIRIAGVIRNITEQKRLAIEKERTERALHTMIEQAPAVVFMKDLESRYLLVNPFLERLFGVGRDQIVGRSIAEIQPRAISDQIREHDLRVIRTGKAHTFEEHLQGPDGSAAIYQSTKFPLFDTSGEVYALAAIALDITLEKRARALIEEQRAQLIQSSKLSTLGEMAGGVAHEINNPVAIIHASASQLKAFVEEDALTKERANICADRILRTADRIARIVRGLRAFAREADDEPMESVALGSVISDTLELCQSRFKHHEIELRVSQGADAVNLVCRPVQVSQVLLNLLGNAFDAVQNMSGAWVAIEVASKNGWVEIAVVDSGPGVPPDVREKIMEPFFTTKEIGKGTGLGLSIATGIARSHGGSLLLDILHPHTRFVLRLPLDGQARGGEALPAG